jgi:hypothetical protein
MAPPLFRYDFNSPYAYLAAHRVDDLIPGVEWQPIGFAFLSSPRSGSRGRSENGATRGWPSAPAEPRSTGSPR